MAAMSAVMSSTTTCGARIATDREREGWIRFGGHLSYGDTTSISGGPMSCAKSNPQSHRSEAGGLNNPQRGHLSAISPPPKYGCRATRRNLQRHSHEMACRPYATNGIEIPPRPIGSTALTGRRVRSVFAQNHRATDNAPVPASIFGSSCSQPRRTPVVAANAALSYSIGKDGRQHRGDLPSTSPVCKAHVIVRRVSNGMGRHESGAAAAQGDLMPWRSVRAGDDARRTNPH